MGPFQNVFEIIDKPLAKHLISIGLTKGPAKIWIFILGDSFSLRVLLWRSDGASASLVDVCFVRIGLYHTRKFCVGAYAASYILLDRPHIGRNTRLVGVDSGTLPAVAVWPEGDVTCGYFWCDLRDRRRVRDVEVYASFRKLSDLLRIRDKCLEGSFLFIG